MWWRIDDVAPAEWSWEPFGRPRHRFDPPSGRFRLRYAANDPVAAARERFGSRRLAEPHGRLWLVRLQDPPPALHLTHQRTLDALALGDRVNTGRLDVGPDPLLATSQALADRVWDWWDGEPPPLVYRIRTVPAARSVAFGRWVRWGGVTARPVREATSLLAALVLHHGFDVPEAWLR